MRVWDSPETFHDERRTVVSVGNFDGVHLGHAKLIGEAVRLAHEEGLSSAIVTFEPHTRTAMRQQGRQPLLSSFEEKALLLECMGVDHVVRIAFDESFRRTHANEFVESVLAGQLKASAWVMGQGHRVGKDRMGDPSTLRDVLSRNDIRLISAQLLADGEDVVSSTAIRAAIRDGRIAQAVQMLGHPYLIAARRVKGKGLGSELGYPTLNFGEPTADKVLPPAGVYAAQLRTDATAVAGALYFGTCPTFGKRERHFEVHLIGDHRNVPKVSEIGYLWLHRFIRADRTFSSRDELVRQIENDVEQISKVVFAEEKLHAIDEGKDAGDY